MRKWPYHTSRRPEKITTAPCQSCRSSAVADELGTSCSIADRLGIHFAVAGWAPSAVRGCLFALLCFALQAAGDGMTDSPLDWSHVGKPARPPFPSCVEDHQYQGCLDVSDGSQSVPGQIDH
ncbi:hypothetical protein LZ31DRAFT_341366 [Colletotrichum somersetense]|nr:hypothetical protein LZ31DRAFT_341366 [Colletotrichum somersetense]